jgi:ubiquinol-cytochrome c reductase cytochrome b subunit
MFSAILIIISLSYLDLSKVRGLQFRPISKAAYYLFGATFIGLLILGAKHVESPFIEYGQIHTAMYFLFFLLIIPTISYMENVIIINSIIKTNTRN